MPRGICVRAGVTVDVKPFGRIRDALQLLGGLLMSNVREDVGGRVERVLTELILVSDFLRKVH
jgi:hypothetical protein